LDGGKGQLSKCLSILNEIKVKNIVVIAVAKGKSRKPGHEQLFLTTQDQPINLASDSPALHLIQRIRDEAHRFAITGHRQRRSKNRKQSRLDGIEGLGPIKRRDLLKQFGGIHGVMKAGIDDLVKINGISKSLSIRIFNNLHNHS
jgi:excinuclease ABC subunit C